MTQRFWPLAVAVLLLFFIVPLGLHGLWIPDESRYAQISQAILHSGDWVSPHFLGLRYFEKPIAGYWLVALGQMLFGENLFGVRIASVVVTLASTLMVLFVGRRMWPDSRRGEVAALLYASFALIAGQAGYSNMDPQFTLWTNLSIAALWLAFQAEDRRGRLLAWGLLGAACAMGFMTKGFLAGLLPVLVALPYVFWLGRWRELFGYGPLAVLVAVLLSLPWGLAIYAREPDFWNFFFWHEHIRRFAGEDAQHSRPFWFFVPLLFASALPWALLIPSAFARGWAQRRQPHAVFLLLWFAMPFLFFSLAKGKLPTYTMPCFAPLALLMADAVLAALESGRLRVLRFNGWLNLVGGLLALGGLVFIQLHKPVYHHQTASVLLVGLVCLAWAVCGGLQLAPPPALWAAPAVAAWLLVAVVPAAMPEKIVNSKMPDQFIAQYQDQLASAHTLLSNDLGTASALAWRTGRANIQLLNTVGELKYGLSQPDAKGRTLSLEEFPAWLAEARKQGSVGVIMRVNSAGDEAELALMPKDSISYRENHLVFLLIPQAAP
ncbi:Undecaprenyl phosphate-alpha-4-amino-4-deoxy-L-arabinose arabinosyl transferase 2 [Pseudomonas knackmussii B13]|uniref:Undecaprenyl phosphate-alpha-4-amino-4-deoxy-L-arabinose arabinosyl transferase n=1 Tax=Pseudomonas knackmussii (strain DSM 6978 / CCUG 54928 / LMG 23759 / B13) TaxID=1301098 RepID=A0A024HNF7_PSEKB|nr:lipid IV(A) 4-amino-4-deoxy-L-arabinosyltransferase [Pseudomonas knackmussii]CDF86047.1 Undecaprenyl phosphate-alpha-4-amino-4-deoxy-L-arabinose arabinosyl transferase 2 [Pseudomonas knackmussii B13]